jgi:hypothetical protein
MDMSLVLGMDVKNPWVSGFEAGSNDGLNLDQFEQLCKGTWWIWWRRNHPVF